MQLKNLCAGKSWFAKTSPLFLVRMQGINAPTQQNVPGSNNQIAINNI
jgi:hypothetical protein